MNDDPSEAVDLHRFLLKTSVLQDIHDAIIHDKDVLVHCQLGMQRSPAVVACYLITYTEAMTPETAIAFIRAQRAIAFPGGSRFQDAIEATYRDKLQKKSMFDSAAKHQPTAAGGAMDMIEKNPLTSLLVQPLRRLAEIVSDDLTPHATTGKGDLCMLYDTIILFSMCIDTLSVQTHIHLLITCPPIMLYNKLLSFLIRINE